MKAYIAVFSTNSVYENMAIDEYLYYHYDEPVIRFYAFDRPSLTIGYNQRYERSCNTDYIEENNIPITRRLTGGRTVYHCGDLTYSFSSSFDAFKYVLEGSNNLQQRYKKLSEAFVAGFRESGIDVQVNTDQSDIPYSENCFSSTSLYEITLNGEKILGSAQTFLKDRFMQQGTILVKQCNDDKHIFNKAYKSNNIENIQNLLYNIEELSRNFNNAFKSVLPFEWEIINISKTDSEIKEIMMKYSSIEWLRRR